MENDTVGNMPLVRTTTLGSARQAVEIAHGPSVKGTMPAPTTRQLRVCHIAATTEGAAWVFEQVRDLRDRFGYDVSVILNGTSGALVDRFNAAGIRVLASDFQFLGGGDLFALPKRILDLGRILERERFDIIQTHLFHSMVIGRRCPGTLVDDRRPIPSRGLYAELDRWLDAVDGYRAHPVLRVQPFTVSVNGRAQAAPRGHLLRAGRDQVRAVA
jgi:hypothetical protein